MIALISALWILGGSAFLCFFVLLRTAFQNSLQRGADFVLIRTQISSV